MSAFESDAETVHLGKVITALAGYASVNMARVAKARSDYARFAAEQGEALTALLPSFPAKFDRIEACLHMNQQFLDEIIVPHRLFENAENPLPVGQVFDFSTISDHDAEKVRSTLRQVVRDWSLEGQLERDICYRPLIDELLRRCPPNQNGPVEVLVPGAGLGRLVNDVAKLGYRCQGNEFSYYMLLTSEFILNRLRDFPAGIDICPFALQFSNVWSAEHQTRRVHIPDVPPGDLADGGMMSMVAGDFLEVYHDQVGAWNCVVTCFFLDTAKNIVDYVRLIHRILAPGGFWINLGPLLYHYEDMPGEASLELAYDELRHVVTSVGFEILEESRVNTPYAANMLSMNETRYDAILFSARKQWL